MPVKGVSNVKNNLKYFVDATDKKTMQFVNAVGAEAGILSKQKAPIEYGTLHNSQRFDVRKVGASVIGTLGYYVSYASILNDGKYRWQPRPPERKAGPAWNPKAEPFFLQYGFESAEAQAMIKRHLEIFKI